MDAKYALRMHSIHNAQLANVADMLNAFTDVELLEAQQAIARKDAFPPLWQYPLSRKLALLIAPTLSGELARRWEVRYLARAIDPASSDG